MAKIRISEIEVSRVTPLHVYEGSIETADIDSRHLRFITGDVISRYLSGSQLTSDFSYIDGGVSGDDSEIHDVPHLDDISIVSNTAYYDTAGKIRAKLVFRVKNSSGQVLAGVDVRRSLEGES